MDQVFSSIVKLVHMILHDPVSWPHDMSPAFKDFLQGLLTKDPRLRLQWPELLDHKFVADGINGSLYFPCKIDNLNEFERNWLKYTP